MPLNIIIDGQATLGVTTGLPASIEVNLGVPGPGATVTVGTTETLPAGSDATVDNSGSLTNAVLNFGIPQGIKGDKGDTGSTGAGVAPGGTSGQVLSKINSVDYNTQWINVADISAVWGQITGTLSNQTDLQTVLNNKAGLNAPIFTGYPSIVGNDYPGTIITDLFVATAFYNKTQSNIRFATLASPTFTGDPRAPTPLTTDNDTSIATTAYVKAQPFALLASPTFTGDPKAPTPLTTDNDTSIATTAYVKNNLGSYLPLTGASITAPLVLSSPDQIISFDPTGPTGITIVSVGSTGTANLNDSGLFIENGLSATSIYPGSIIVNNTAYDSIQINGGSGWNMNIGDGYISAYNTNAVNPNYPVYQFSIEEGNWITNGISLSAGSSIQASMQDIGMEFINAGVNNDYTLIAPNTVNVGNVSGTERIDIKGSGITFADQSIQTTAFIPANIASTYLSNAGNLSGLANITTARSNLGLGSMAVETATNYLTTSSAASTYQPISGMVSYLTTANAASTYLTQANAVTTYYPLTGNPSGFLTSASLSNYALLAGATFTGKVILNTGTTSAGFNMATGVTPSAPVNGDLWISSSSIRYKDNIGIERLVADTNRPNVFTTYQTFQSSNNSNPAVLITGTGTADALRVEDSTSPDTTPFAINQNGRVGIGITPDATVALTVDSTGIKFNDGSIQVTRGDRYKATSTTTMVIDGANSKVFQTQTNLAYTQFCKMVIFPVGATTQVMYCTVLSYDPVTGLLDVDSVTHTGSGTYSNWILNIGG